MSIRKKESLLAKYEEAWGNARAKNRNLYFAFSNFNDAEFMQ
jgi:hypothetical protein